MTSTYIFPGKEFAFCEMGSMISCSSVLKSEYASMFGVPLALFGVIYFLLTLSFSIFLAGGREDDKEVSVGFWLLCFIGLGSVFYFLYAEYMVGAICSLCTVVHILVVLMLPLGVKIANIRAPTWKLRPGAVLRLAWDLNLWVVFAVLLIGTPILVSFLFAPRDFAVKYTEASLAEFGKCLKMKRVEVFVTEGCGYCSKQKEVLGAALEHMNDGMW